MSPGPRLEEGDFASTFPARFATAMDRARGVMAGLQSGLGHEGVADDALVRLHEIYRLRIELELETASVLWRTAEIVCALADSMTALANRDRDQAGGTRALLGAEVRRRAAGIEPTGSLGGRPALALTDLGGAPRAAAPSFATHPGAAGYPRAA